MTYKLSNRILQKLPTVLLFLLSIPAVCQHTTIIEKGSDEGHKIVVAGKQYEKNFFHDIIWGKHYRKEWATPVKVNIMRIDTAYGGIKPVEKGGGRQTRNLRFENKNGKQYVLRSIDKSYTKALPAIFSGTFVEQVANDQVSVAHPYAPFTVAPMAATAKINHTNPRLVFLPADSLLGEFNPEFSNQLYLLEERPDGDQHDASYFGNAPYVIGTEKMMENITNDNAFQVDQAVWVRARLFDMFLGDWGRHEDQWRWGEFKKNDLTVYKAIPRDRDQSYTKFDGLLVRLLAPSATVGYLQSFDYTIKDVNKYNYQARHLDRRFANAVSRSVWVATAHELQQLLSDAVIESSVGRLPAEVFSVSGMEIISKLKSRREYLVEFANEYYTVLAKEVDIVGSKQKEVFEISPSDSGELKVNMYRIDNKNIRSLLYSRKFFKNETDEIRIYGLDGNDQFNITYTGAIKVLL